MSSDEYVRHYVESADLVLMLGTFITDMSMGFYTAKLDRKRTVLATSERVNVRYHRYESIQFRDFLELFDGLVQGIDLRLGGLDLRFTDLGEITGRDESRQQADNDHDDQKLEQGEPGRP